MTTLRERIRAGGATRGTMLTLGSTLAAEVCAMSGFDWLLVDLEHGAVGLRGNERHAGKIDAYRWLRGHQSHELTLDIVGAKLSDGAIEEELSMVNHQHPIADSLHISGVVRGQ